MQLALINADTNKVENVIVPPQNADAYFVASGFYGKYCPDFVGTGWTYNKDADAFIAPVVEPTEPEAPDEG